MTNTDELKRLAEAATSGPWEACERGDYSDNEGNSRVILGDDMRLGLVFDYGGDEGKGDAAYIAAANPSAILSLIEEVEGLRKDYTDKAEAWDVLTEKNAEITTLRAELDKALEVIGFYADPAQWKYQNVGESVYIEMCPVQSDKGSKARDFLGASDED